MTAGKTGLLESLWILVLLCACGVLIATDIARIDRVRYVSGIGEATTTLDPASPTGYADGKRWLIVPEHCTPSYQWIEETQQMAANGEWRLRHVDYENAPTGRDVHTALLYHDWLRLLAALDHTVFHTPNGLAVERSALWSEIAVHVILLVSSTLFVAAIFGNLAAITVALAWIALFPVAAAFLPGVPQDLSFAQAFALWSVLPLLLGVSRNLSRAATAGAAAPQAKSTAAGASFKWCFVVAGIAGGFGLWNNAAKEIPVLVGVACGAVLAALVTRTPAMSDDTGARFPKWRVWALSGAVTSLLAYLFEYAPDHLDLRLQVNHPLFAIAWLGIGEVLTQITAWADRGKQPWTWRNTALAAMGSLAIAALPVSFAITKTQGFLQHDPLASRLTALSEGVVANNVLGWMKRDGLSLGFAATFLPILLLIPTLALVFRRTTDPKLRSALALAVGPVVVSVLLALGQLRWWSLTDTAVIASIAPLAAGLSTTDLTTLRKATWGLISVLFVLGLFASTSDLRTRKKDVFTRLEVESLVERDLAYWLADRAAGTSAIVLAPPERTPTLCYFGGLRGVATPNWENQDGVSATVRIASSTTVDEAQALLNQRNVTHVILPSWDSDLDHFVEWNMSHPNDSFLHALHQWALPPWLRALPYKIPTIAGFEDQAVVVLELTDENERAPSLARLAEYFVETQQFDLARAADQSLQVYPADLGALVARAGVEKAVGDADAYAKTFKALIANLSGGNDRMLPWDRRVSLAIVLAQGERLDLARKQVERCLKEIDADRIHFLTTGSLFRLQVLAKAFDLKIADPHLRELALKPLPTELRSRL